MTTALVVDDDPDVLESLAETFSRDLPTWTLITCGKAAEAIKVLETRHIDVVLTDVVMDDDNSAGLRVLRKAKERDGLTMVILMTAYDERLDRYEAFSMGAFDCIQKLARGVRFSDEVIVKTHSAAHVRELALQEIRARETLGVMRRYMDPAVFELLQEDPEGLILRPQVVTICFWDIRGFSKLCEALKAHPRILAAFLTDYFENASDVIRSHKGILDKFIGDGVMALFGAVPGDSGVDGDACQAAAAALALRTSFGELVRRWRSTIAKATPQDVVVGLGSGLHTGEVLVGNVGTKSRDQFTALGPDVNFAQRLEARAGSGEIIVSASTAERIRSEFHLTEAGIIEDVKNILGTFRLFKVDERL